MRNKLRYLSLLFLGLLVFIISSCTNSNETKYELNPEPIDEGQNKSGIIVVKDDIAYLTVKAYRGFQNENEVSLQYGHDYCYVSWIELVRENPNYVIEYDENQELELCVYRYIYNDEDCKNNIIDETETPKRNDLIYRTTFSLGYFTSKNFIYGNEENKIIDKIDISMLSSDYYEHGSIKYFYVVKPVNDSNINYTLSVPPGVMDNYPDGYYKDGLLYDDLPLEKVYSHVTTIYYAIKDDKFTLLNADDVYNKEVCKNIDLYYN